MAQVTPVSGEAGTMARIATGSGEAGPVAQAAAPVSGDDGAAAQEAPAGSAPVGETAPSDAQEPGADRLAAGKALVRRYIEDVLAGGRLDLVEEYVAADYADSTPGADADLAGPALVRRSRERLRTRFRNVRYAVDQLVAEGDLVVARYSVRAVHQPRAEGDAPAAEPRDVVITGMTIFRVLDGKIRETWTINDQLEMFRQLGYTLEEPSAARDAPAPAPAAQPPVGRR